MKTHSPFVFQHGAFAKMYALRTLKLSAYVNVNYFNLPSMLNHNAALKNLMVEMDYGGAEFGKELNSGSLPCKLNNITITGRHLKYLSPYLLLVSMKCTMSKAFYKFPDMAVYRGFVILNIRSRITFFYFLGSSF